MRQPEGLQDPEDEPPEDVQLCGLHLCVAVHDKTSRCVVGGHAMSRVGNPEEFEELWARVKKVYPLWQHQEHHRLGESREYADGREGHACEVAIRVPDEDLRGEPV